MPRALLSADLRRGGLLREARRRRECAEEGEAGGRQEEDVERRRTPRLAGLVPGPGLGGGILGKLYLPRLRIVLCAGTLGGWYLGVECGAEWRF